MLTELEANLHVRGFPLLAASSSFAIPGDHQSDLFVSFPHLAVDDEGASSSSSTPSGVPCDRLETGSSSSFMRHALTCFAYDGPKFFSVNRYLRRSSPISSISPCRAVMSAVWLRCRSASSASRRSRCMRSSSPRISRSWATSAFRACCSTRQATIEKISAPMPVAAPTPLRIATESTTERLPPPRPSLLLKKIQVSSLAVGSVARSLSLPGLEWDLAAPSWHYAQVPCIQVLRPVREGENGVND
jgi:hypothetical protein